MARGLASAGAGPVNVEEPPGDSAESRLCEILDDWYEEGRKYRDSCVPPKQRDADLAVYRGEFETKDPYFKGNFVKAFVNRQVAQLTDNRPILRVGAQKAGLRPVAKACEAIIKALWEEADQQRQTVKQAHTAATMASAGLYTVWDDLERQARLIMIRPADMVADPTVTEAARLSVDAEYVFIDFVQPLDLIVARFPGRGRFVQADATLSDLSPATASSTGTVSPLSRWLKGGDARSVALPRAKVRHCLVKDRRRDATGRAMFPGGRLIIKSDDVVLWDGPNPNWEGEHPIDWFDWEVDPEHMWGHSEVSTLTHMQTAFNALVDGTVEASILSNFLKVMGDADAIPEETWRKLQNIRGSVIIRKRNRNATFDIVPPTIVGQDRVNLARWIFTFAQILTGVTDVTMGENPGSLQSGIAIEGLQEAANLMTRARASRYEDFMVRVGQRLLARHFQYWTSDRVLSLLGTTQNALAYANYRKGFYVHDNGTLVTEEERRMALRDFKLSIMPGTSAPGARKNRMLAAAEMNKAGLVPKQFVLEMGDIPNPEELIEQATREMKELAPFMAAMKQMG